MIEQIGPYRVLGKLGEGGMGEVYRARDTKLGRDVALKVLPESLAADPERVARMHREAQVLAALNHPHIAAIHGFEDSGATHALVLEFVDGETLADRIARGAIPIDEALPIARQIAEALEAAHEQGIIHRDLKPANIKVRPDGTVKVLDFGLAKLTEGPGAAAANPASLSMSPTITSPAMMTGVGMLLGTAAYMSPEQAKGRPADKRSDIWAFGGVLFEMLTGTRAFEGEDISDTLAAVLRAEPDWAALPSDVPYAVRRLVMRCLEKDRRQRIGDVSTALFLIDEASSLAASTSAGVGTVPAMPPRAAIWRRAIPLLGAAAAASAIVGAIAWGLRPVPSTPIVTRFSVGLADGERLTNTGRQVVAISPDGTRMVYVANTRLYVRPMSDAEAKPLPGTDASQGVLNPVFSPDGRSVAFWSTADSTIKRISIDGGAAVTICPAERPLGISWTADEILFGEGPAGIMRVPASGGKPEVLLKVGDGEVADGPQMLPDGETVLFTVATGSRVDRWDRAKVVVQSSKSGQRKTVIDGGSAARYLPTGHVVYALAGTLLAVPFDVNRLEVTGSAVPIVEGVSRADTPGQQTGVAHFSVSSNGSMVYVPGPVAAGPSQRGLVRVDVEGKVAPFKIPAGPYEFPRVSPDGTRLAFGIDDGREAAIWMYDLAGTSAMRRLTFGGNSRFPIWSADGERVAFQSDRDGDIAIFWQRADGTGTAERLTRPDKGVAHVPLAWAPAGERFLFGALGNGESAGASLWTFSLRDSKAEPFGGIQYRGTTRPPSAAFSPDGRWVAYSSYEAAAFSVYVQPFPATGARYQIARGNFPLWSRDGRTLFYQGNDQVSAVKVETVPAFTFGNSVAVPGALFPNNLGLTPVRQFDIAPDGGIISVVDSITAAAATPGTQHIEVVVNWFEELKRRVPAN